MGQTGSPPKWLAFIDPLLWWLDACGVKGVEVRRGGRRVAVMAFADDLVLFVPGSMANVQRALHLVDRFFQLFGVELQAKKSVAMKVGGESKEDKEWKAAEQLWVERETSVGGERRVVRMHLRRAGSHEGVAYLGARVQADGRWTAAEREVTRKTAQWCAHVGKSKVTAGQAARLLHASVGGLVQYVAQAVPQGEACMRRIDE